MTITIELKKLFDEWENAFPDYKGKFVSDGIINDPLYQNAKSKILFIVKEPNNPKQTSWDLAGLLNKECKGNFSRRLAEWSYGMLNDFPTFTSMTDNSALHQALKSTAIINLKKNGGAATSKMEEIISHTIQNKTFIQKQIKLISPNIIVGGVGNSEIWKLLFDNIELISSDYDKLIGRWNNIKIIHYYHPSYYKIPKAMSYSLLQNIIQSKSFVEL